MKSSKPFIILTILVIFFCLISFPLFLKIPPIWFDEGEFANMIRNYLTEGRLGLDITKAVPGFEVHNYLYPPIFFLINIIWFKVVPFSIYNQRLLIFIISLIFIFIYYKFINLFIRNKFLIFLSIIALIIDDIFIYNSRFSRPDIPLLLFGFISLYLYQKCLTIKFNLKAILLCITSGLFAVLAFLTHYIGFFILLILFSFQVYITVVDKRLFKINILRLILLLLFISYQYYQIWN
jgi:predicted membrane-bound mannosyltransferase